MSYQPKEIEAIVYNPAGAQIATWRDFLLENFSKEINAGLGDCLITLARRFDYNGGDLAEGNEVELRVSDRETRAATTPGDPSKTIYRGYVSLISRLGEKTEKIEVTLLGYYTRLALDILKNGTQTTLYSNNSSGLTITSASQNAADIGAMFRAVIDRYRAETSGPKIYYRAAEIPDTGTTATYRFAQQYYKDALEKLRSLAPAGTFWYCDPTGRVTFGQKPTTPTHKFIFGKHFEKVSVQRSIEKVRNTLLIWNGETGGSKVYKHYEDASSIATYGRRVETLNDYSIDNVNAADLIGAKFLADNKWPETKVVCTIADSNGTDGAYGYDIESIEPGQTCSFYGFSSDAAEIFRDNMLITKVVYHPDYAEVEVEVVKSGLLDFQDQQRRDIKDVGGGRTVPESYT